MKKEVTQEEQEKDMPELGRNEESDVLEESTKESPSETEVQLEKVDELSQEDEIKISKQELKSLIDDLQKVKDENEELKNDFLRAKAELENTRKRLIRHYDELSKERTKQLLLDVVNLLDNFDRAFDAATSSEAEETNTSSILEGIKLIESQFIQVLENKWKVVPFEAVHDSFNPDIHEAMMREEKEDISEPMVIDVFSKGYMIDDKILRPAKVKVATPKQ